MDERIKYLMYGLAFGRKLPVREKEPGHGPDVPVESITLVHDGYIVTAGIEFNILCLVYPENATNKEVTWSSSNNSVATVTKLTEDTCTVYGLSEGSTTITCTSVSNASIYSSVTLAVEESGEYIEFSALYKGMINVFNTDIHIEAQYLPKLMAYDKWSIDVKDSIGLSGKGFNVLDTGFDNIKCIRAVDSAGGYDRYSSNVVSGERCQLIDISTSGGVGDVQNMPIVYDRDAQSLNYDIYKDLWKALYGFDNIETPIQKTIYVGRGVSVNFGAFSCIRESSFYTISSLNPSIRYGIYHSFRVVGDYTIKLMCDEIEFVEYTVFCRDFDDDIKEKPYLGLVNDYGMIPDIKNETLKNQNFRVARLAFYGIYFYTGISNTISSVLPSNIFEIRSDEIVRNLGNYGIADITIQSKWVIDGEKTTENTVVSLNGISDIMSVGTCVSDYTRDIIHAYVRMRAGARTLSRISRSRISVTRPGGTLEEIGTLEYNNRMNTVELDFDTADEQVIIFSYLKQTTEPVTIGFKVNGSNALEKSITI